jgi:hypothetical protein
VSTDGAIGAATENNGRVEGEIVANASTICITLTSAAGTTHTFDGANNDVRTHVERFVNLSTRSQTGGGQVLIAGFVIAGTQPKHLLIRAVGPTLGTSFRVSNALSAARLEIFKGATSIAGGGDWGAAADAAAIAEAAVAVGAFPLARDSRDAALLLTLEPGAYTAVVTGQGVAAGVALVEVYDATPGAIAPSERVINLSGRATVGTGDNALFAGFVITGTVPKRVLLRAAGPALKDFPGIGDVLARPQIRVHSGQTVIAENAGWSTSADAAAISGVAREMGAFAFGPNSMDAALLVSLHPGVYTAELAGAGGGTGLALFEMYELP